MDEGHEVAVERNVERNAVTLRAPSYASQLVLCVGRVCGRIHIHVSLVQLTGGDKRSRLAMRTVQGLERRGLPLDAVAADEVQQVPHLVTNHRVDLGPAYATCLEFRHRH